MKKFLLISALISLSCFSSFAQAEPPSNVVLAEAGTWIKAAPATKGFTILLPGKPAEASQAVTGRPELENFTLTLETSLAGYVVSYVPFPSEVTDPAAVKEILDRGRDGGLASSKGTLVSEKEIKLNDYPGREWLINLPGNLQVTARAYWVKRRLYQTVFVALPSNSSPEKMKLTQEAKTRFLDSFTLTADATK